jgi:hypothetical protein
VLTTPNGEKYAVFFLSFFLLSFGEELGVRSSINTNMENIPCLWKRVARYFDFDYLPFQLPLLRCEVSTPPSYLTMTNFNNTPYPSPLFFYSFSERVLRGVF